ncbi:hypothetical protein KCM76_11815 [Zooshikella marina]|uniref:hypothetical protein n=1 Tax=Zooshikella ganghwensis TaxID=202772 RepID=UPI001BAFA52A|nr:hypothetical protein [Zooshikella ganghwensis]MBU2706671.1 hypothetical protein [Zooshikella ganghwensis]
MLFEVVSKIYSRNIIKKFGLVCSYKYDIFDRDIYLLCEKNSEVCLIGYMFIKLLFFPCSIKFFSLKGRKEIESVNELVNYALSSKTQIAKTILVKEYKEGAVKIRELVEFKGAENSKSVIYRVETLMLGVPLGGALEFCFIGNSALVKLREATELSLINI